MPPLQAAELQLRLRGQTYLPAGRPSRSSFRTSCKHPSWTARLHRLTTHSFPVVKGYLSELSTKSSATVLLFAAPTVRHDMPTANRFNDVGDHLQSTFSRQLQGGSMIPAPPTSTARPRSYMLSSKVTSTPGYKHSLGRLARLANQSQVAANLDEE